MLSHQPVKRPCVAQIVLLSGSSDGRTTVSSENADGVQAAAAGTSAYWLVPLNVTAVSGSPVSRPLTPRCGEPTKLPSASPCWSTRPRSSRRKRQYERGASPPTALA